MGDTVIALIGDRLNNICDGNFLVITHEGKHIAYNYEPWLSFSANKVKNNLQFSQDTYVNNIRVTDDVIICDKT